MELFHGLSALTWQQVVMVGVGLLLIYLATVKEYEPSLLLPMGFGTLLVNIPLSSALTHVVGNGVEVGAISRLFEMGIQTEMFPLLVFIAVGAMIDFTPLFQTPVTMIFGLMAQAGIFLTMGLAHATGFFDLREAASIGIIGAADGPTSIYVANRFAPQLLGSISVAAYSYMALVPIIQPPVIRLLTTAAERRIAMPYHEKPVSKRKKVLFPILVTLISGFLVPASAALIGFLMFGNLLRESGVVDRLAKGAQNELANIVTILLGLAISTKMTGEDLLRPMTLGIMGSGGLRAGHRSGGRDGEGPQPLPAPEDQPHDRRGGHIRLSHVLAGDSEDGHGRGQEQLHPDAGRRGQRLRTDRLGPRRRAADGLPRRVVGSEARRMKGRPAPWDLQSAGRPCPVPPGRSQRGAPRSRIPVVESPSTSGRMTTSPTNSRPGRSSAR